MKFFLLLFIFGFSYLFLNFVSLPPKKVSDFDKVFEIALPLGQENLKNDTLFSGFWDTYTYNRIYKQNPVPNSLDSAMYCNLQYYKNFYEKLYKTLDFPLQLSLNSIGNDILNAYGLIATLDDKEQNSQLSLYGYALMRDDTIAFLANTHHAQVTGKNYVLIATIKNQKPYSYLALGYEIPLPIDFLTCQFYISMDTIYTNEFDLAELSNGAYGQNKYIIQDDMFIEVEK